MILLLSMLGYVVIYLQCLVVDNGVGVSSYYSIYPWNIFVFKVNLCCDVFAMLSCAVPFSILGCAVLYMYMYMYMLF